VAALGAGTFVHLIVCWTVLSIGYMRLDPIEFFGLASLSAAGFMIFALIIGSDWNLTFEDPDFSLAQMLWALSVVIMTTHFVIELKPAVLLTGLALVVMGANRLSRKEQIVFALYGLSMYLLSIFFLSQAGTLAWVTELVVMFAFGLVLIFGPALYRFELGLIENVLLDKNHELSIALEQIRDLAVKDELTGAYNRRHVMEVLAHQKALADRGDYTFTLCFVDLDFFKRVNDRFGHSTGDHVLKNFSSIANSVLREVDCVARMGGEEFLLVFASTTQREAYMGAQRLAIGMKDMIVSRNEPQYRITASMGVTEYRDGEDVQVTLDRADRALYDAKRTGRNKVLIAGAAHDLKVV
jgi:diguanylate cyclase (GGDEF)-like protein